MPAAQTDAERRAAIDRQMDESLGTFDESIRKERERIARERDARVASSGGSGEGNSDGAAGDASGGRAGDLKQGEAAAENQQTSQTGGDLKSEGAGGGGGGTGGSAKSGSGPSTPARDIPDGRDDDIIARQIREAAEKETDPELRDKLWKEYIEYKKSVKK